MRRRAVAGLGAMPRGARSGQATGRLRPGEEEVVAFFFSLESFKLHCHDCFYLKKKRKKKKRNKNEKLL